MLDVAQVDDLLGHDFVVLHGKEPILREFIVKVCLDLPLRTKLFWLLS